ncbi:M4 family metallopeptidase [Streptomyces sp. 5-10]|uniref:M4 family metallopeptidase n=1 Tax=Streptomyces sp. 5-10 TaxID=878925 RepID=UPI00168B7EC2|nr:M4 family metallopeptidase [Streptomyces sp. 5-10]MBD3004560.1 M4 family metallopeptidase [Streptomyces sp. 5-10]
MQHSILPPHLTAHLAKTNPKFRSQLHQDMGIRHVRASLDSKSEPGEISVYDANSSMDLPPKKKAGQNLPQAQRVRKWAQVTSEVMEVGDFPDGVVRYGVDYVNAFYDGQFLVFGMGDGEVFGDFTLGLDVFAHEFGHKLIDGGPRLEYFGQPGALNEHLADVIGVSVREKEAKEGGDDSGPNWRIGAELFLDGKSALRDMKDPGTAYDNLALGKDPQVGHMDDYEETFMDNGGVHINSGIPNRAFALFAELVDGPVWEAPLRTWMRAANKSKPQTNFEEFAKFTIEVAGKHEDKVAKAWSECGIEIGGSTPTPAPAPAPEPDEKPEPTPSPNGDSTSEPTPEGEPESGEQPTSEPAPEEKAKDGEDAKS